MPKLALEEHSEQDSSSQVGRCTTLCSGFLSWILLILTRLSRCDWNLCGFEKSFDAEVVSTDASFRQTKRAEVDATSASESCK